MKSRLAIGAVGVVVLLGTATACSSSGDSGEKETTTLTLLSAAVPGTPGGDAYEALFKDFEADTGIAIEIMSGGDDNSIVFETAAAAGEMPDLVFINGIAPIEWAEQGLVVTVDDYMDEWGIRDRILPAAYDEIDQDFGMPGFPYEGYQWPMWFNTDLLEQAGITDIPSTTDDLIAAADALRAAGFQPMSVGGADWSGQKLFFQIAQNYTDTDALIDLYSNGGWCGSADGMKGIELFTELRDAGVFVDNAEGYEATSMTAQFMAGESAMMPAGSWTISEVPNGVAGLEGTITFGGMSVPSSGQFAKPTAFQGVSNGWFISSSGAEKKIDAIQKFITYMYTPEVTASLINGVDLILTTVNDDATLEGGNPLVAQIQTQLPETVDYALLPDFYIGANITDSVIRATAQAFQPGFSAEDICKTIDSVYAG